MYNQRKKLQKELESIPGIEAVYFSPPAGIKMEYPCIVYSVNNDLVHFADNISYHKKKQYTVTIIDEDPDSILPEYLSKFQYCSLDRVFIADGLNHFVYTLYY